RCRTQIECIGDKCTLWDATERNFLRCQPSREEAALYSFYLVPGFAAETGVVLHFYEVTFGIAESAVEIPTFRIDHLRPIWANSIGEFSTPAFRLLDQVCLLNGKI